MAKRGQNEGSIHKREDGRWVATVNLGFVNGKRKRKSFYGKTRAEVAEQLTKALSDRDRGLPIATERQTVEQFLTAWLENTVKPKNAPRTSESYHAMCRLHIIPDLGRVQLHKLTPQQVQALMQRKLDAGPSPRTVAYMRSILRIALNQALKWGMVGRNVAALVDPPRQRRYEARPFTPEQARAFLAAVKGDRMEALYTVALSLGLRQGEALGVRWQDIDLENGTLTVRYQLQRYGGKLHLSEPKTEKSRRTVSLPAVCVAALRAHRVRQLEEQLAAGSAWRNEHGLVFTTPIGTPCEPANVTAQFRGIVERSGLPRQRFHDLRHCCASLLAAQGVPPRMVMEVLGHSQLATTMDLYSHIFPEARRETADLMDAILAVKEG